MNAYCRGNLDDLKKETFPAYWVELEQTIRWEGAAAFTQRLRQFCPRRFEVKKIELKNEYGAKNKKMKTATMFFVSELPDADSQETSMMEWDANFILNQRAWQYIDLAVSETTNDISPDFSDN